MTTQHGTEPLWRRSELPPAPARTVRPSRAPRPVVPYHDAAGQLHVTDTAPVNTPNGAALTAHCACGRLNQPVADQAAGRRAEHAHIRHVKHNPPVIQQALPIQ